MGQMRFYAPTPGKISAEAVQRAYVAGMEAIPWCSRNSWSDGCLLVERASSESGCLYIPWEVDGLASRVLSTCSLMDRPRPYCLPVEVARGTLHRARSLAADLEFRGQQIPGPVRALLKESLADFLRASTAAECGDEPAGNVVQLAYRAIQQLVPLDWQQKLAAIQQNQSRLPTLLMGRLDDWPLADQACDAFLKAFNAISVPFCWRELQPAPGQFQWQHVEERVNWCRRQGRPIIGGPLLQLDPRHLPDWVVTQDADYQQFENTVVEFLHQVTQRFAGHVDVWCCASGLNVRRMASFCEELKLRLAVASIETVKRAGGRTPVFISFDQPWAEYLVSEDLDLSPLHFADALVRADLGLAGVGLEINLGFWPRGTLPRDLLEISRHIDRWSQLGIPLIVQLTLPSSAQPDPGAIGSAHVVTWPQDGQLLPALDQREMDQLLPLLCSKPSVQGVMWGQLSDRPDHEWPHAGALDASGQPKPLLEQLAAFRRTYLQ